MNEKNTKKIFNDFPEFFKHKDNLQASLMAFGIETDDGWFGLVYNLCKDIREYFTKTDKRHKIPEEFYVTQIKEKFGGLRFYITYAPKEVHDMIHKAEDDSLTICEKCGKSGILRNDFHWWLTLCEQHYKERLIKK